MKVNWIKIIRDYAGSIIYDNETIVVRPGAEEKEITSLENVLGVIFGEEFRELYKTADGFGISSNGSVQWIVVPLEEIPSLVDQHKKRVFKNSSEKLIESALRYVPFIQWSCGDTSGLMRSCKKSGNMGTQVWMFDHEALDGGNGEEEFLYITDETIFEFLIS
jgi:hypothetical protein